MPYLSQALRRLTRPFTRERDLTMVWEVAKRGRRSRLVGAAHLFPYHFRGTLACLIGAARAVVFEGPLDAQSMRRVTDAGSQAVHVSLYHVLDAAARSRICRSLGFAPGLDAQPLYSELFFGRPEQWLEDELRRLKPWMGFFGLWTRYRSRAGGSYSIDLDAHRMAGALGKQLEVLETIEEQIAALEAIPLERIVRFVGRADWEQYDARYVRCYLEGDLDGLIEVAREFPTFCEPVIGRRDALLAERMTPALERGDACVFIGITHCPGVLSRLRAAGWAIGR